MIPAGIRQRADGDCGVASLAQLAEVAYEDAYVAVAAVDPQHRGKKGLYGRELVAAAAHLELTLEPRRRYDLDEEEGILRVRWNDPRRGDPGGHYVAVKGGFIICPSDGNPVPWRDYLKRFTARPCTLLAVVD
jgi:hypothetical protein